MHVSTDCDGTPTEIQGEIDVRCQPWDPAAWTTSAWTGDAWTGVSWKGSEWSGVSWKDVGWSAANWTGSAGRRHLALHIVARFGLDGGQLRDQPLDRSLVEGLELEWDLVEGHIVDV